MTIFERSHHLQSIFLGIQPVTFRGSYMYDRGKPPPKCHRLTQPRATQKAAPLACLPVASFFLGPLGLTLGILVMTEIF